MPPESRFLSYFNNSNALFSVSFSNFILLGFSQNNVCFYSRVLFLLLENLVVMWSSLRHLALYFCTKNLAFLASKKQFHEWIERKENFLHALWHSRNESPAKIDNVFDNTLNFPRSENKLNNFFLDKLGQKWSFKTFKNPLEIQNQKHLLFKFLKVNSKQSMFNPGAVDVVVKNIVKKSLNDCPVFICS